MQEFTEHYRNRFDRLLLAMRLGNYTVRERLWSDIVNAYSESHRHYHTAQHIMECLDLFDQYHSSFGISPLETNKLMEMELAIWWHDIVYYIHRSPLTFGNEELSAAYAFSTLARYGSCHLHTSNFVYDCILATKHQQKVSDLFAWVADIDMAILGAEKSRFDEYELQIKKEYTGIATPFSYLKGRLHFLRTLLEGNQPLYYTSTFRDVYEERAHNNIQQLLEKLEAEEATYD